MNIQINGQPRETADNLTVAALLEELGYGEKRVAVERNGELVPKSRHGEELLADGDHIEIVQAIGGG
ncbi:sulfur carrier protein ThiS [Wenzhouxiangella sp. AB-CW3]|uniref:sulfur carrier protein ThiS n=1 Tax=Wenzhouxiangella sp. AB-CW3 TaxID=2771012 RepID=UPI00168C061E|nr:sulfur carrier protein ThiS [Wenzhouxiangella sp. AB-CW3]QOC22971.1 sulfur carrier protein ThiS [Wenzhouxiangella sp. AB-CW3]